MADYSLKKWAPEGYAPLSPPHITCEACPLHLGSIQTVGVPGVFCTDSQGAWPTQNALICIGQNPGRQEDAVGLPFVGPTGFDLHTVILRFLKAKARYSVYLLNAYRCYHDTGSPQPTYISRCMSHLYGDMRQITGNHKSAERRIILCLGQPAWGAVARMMGVASSLEGFLFNHQGLALQVEAAPGVLSTWQVFGTYHPAYIMRKRSALFAMQDHLRLVRDAMDGVLPVPSKPQIIPARLPARSSS